jgi:hypothetical protein
MVFSQKIQSGTSIFVIAGAEQRRVSSSVDDLTSAVEPDT